MEFDFRYAKGEVQVRLEAGFELLANWVEQELLPYPERIVELKGVVESLGRSVIKSWQVETAEHLLVMDTDELQLWSHSALHSDTDAEAMIPEIADGFASEMDQVECGVEDFKHMLLALDEFVGDKLVLNNVTQQSSYAAYLCP